GAGQAQDQPHAGQPERKSRQREMPKSAPEAGALSENREPTESNREDVQQQGAGRERGRADSDDAGADDRAIRAGAAPRGSEHAERNSDQERDGERESAELERESQPSADRARDRLVCPDRPPEV